MPLLAAGALGPGSGRWPRRVIQPAGSPLRELAMPLADIAGVDPVSVYQSLSAAPGEAPMLVEHAVRAAVGRAANPGQGASADAAAPALPRLVLVVDQFEELFTTGRDGKAGRVEREAFITALHAAATVPAGPHKRAPALVVAAVRADFLGQLIAYAARLVFTQLTAITPDGQFARRRCSRTDLRSPEAETAADINAVIDIFSAHRLLVLGRDSIEISHDVLLQAWKQLRDWLEDDQFDRILHSQVATDAQIWDINRRDSSYLYRPGRLATVDAAALRWQDASTRYPPLSATTKAFLRAAHHAATRSTRRRRAGIAGFLALTVISISAAGIAARAPPAPAGSTPSPYLASSRGKALLSRPPIS